MIVPWPGIVVVETLGTALEEDVPEMGTVPVPVAPPAPTQILPRQI